MKTLKTIQRRDTDLITEMDQKSVCEKRMHHPVEDEHIYYLLRRRTGTTEDHPCPFQCNLL